MPNYLPRDWLAMRQAVFDWARAVLDPSIAVYWSRQDAPSPPLPRVRLNVVTPSVATGQDELRSQGLLVIVSAVVDSTDYVVDVGASSFTHPSGAGASQESIRDGLIALINAGPEEVTATEDGADRFLLVFSGESLAVNVGANLALKTRREVLGERAVVFGVDIMVDPKSDETVAILETLRGSLENPQYLEILQAGGWAVRGIEGTRKGDAVISAAWQGRSGFDVRLGCRSLSVGAVDFIESVSINSGLPGGP